MKNRFYYDGGMAELVAHPSDITYEYLERWFTGFGSLGRAMKILGLPYTPTERSVLVRYEGDLYTDLKVEEETLYRDTIFSYVEVEENKQPRLIVNFLKLFSLRCWVGTYWLLSAQTKWLVNPEKIVEEARQMLDEVSRKKESRSLVKIDETLFDFVWPRMIVVGLWAEFFEKMLEKDDPIGRQRKELSRLVAKEDWFFRSYSDMYRVKSGEMSLLKFVKEYGTRADRDYELSCPRWFENTNDLMLKIKKSKEPDLEETGNQRKSGEYSKYFDAAKELFVVRTEMRKETLRFVGALRAELLKSGRLHEETVKIKTANDQQTLVVKEGLGMGVSEGKVFGKAKIFGVGKDVIVSNAIGVFPNASPEFSIFYPHCKGIIFLRGGMTSHGVIVAREYGIPAIVDSKAECIKRGERVEIDGQRGAWCVVKAKRK